MHEPIRQRCIQLANLLIETNKTVRALAEQTGYSKSTIHKDLTERLPQFSEQLAKQVKHILEQHKAIRHLRGGEATRAKWARMKDDSPLENVYGAIDGELLHECESTCKITNAAPTHTAPPLALETTNS